jgi:tetratricopeptide (TPR) repeat protein
MLKTCFQMQLSVTILEIMQNKLKNMENPPSSYQDLLDKVQHYQDAQDYQKALQLHEPAIKEWQGEKDLKYTELLRRNAMCCSFVNEHNKCILSFEECLNIYKDLNQSLDVELLSLLGRSYFNVADYKTSAKWLLQCLQLAEKQQIKNVDSIVATQELLGACYYRLNNFKMSYKYLSTSIELQIAKGRHLKLSAHRPLKMLISTCDCEHLKLKVPLAKYLKLELDLMKKHKHSPIQEYSETLVDLLGAKSDLSEFDDCFLEYINEVRCLLNKAEFNGGDLWGLASDLSLQFKKFEEAIEILEHAKKDKQLNQAFMCLILMAKIKVDHFKKYDEGLQNCHEALNLCQSMEGGGQFEKCVILRTIGDIYNDQKKYHDSLKYFEKAIEETNKTSKASRPPDIVSELQLCQLWLTIARTQCELDMPKTALSSIKKSWYYLRIVDDKRHPKELAYIMIMKGRCYRKMGNYKKAISFTNTAIEHAVIASGVTGFNRLDSWIMLIFLAGCAKLANDKKCVDDTYKKFIHIICITCNNSDELIEFINDTKNASYIADDHELFMSKLKNVVDHRPLMLSNAPPDFLPKLLLYLNSWAISNLLKTSVSQLMYSE